MKTYLLSVEQKLLDKKKKCHVAQRHSSCCRKGNVCHFFSKKCCNGNRFREINSLLFKSNIVVLKKKNREASPPKVRRVHPLELRREKKTRSKLISFFVVFVFQYLSYPKNISLPAMISMHIYIDTQAHICIHKYIGIHVHRYSSALHTDLYLFIYFL